MPIIRKPITAGFSSFLLCTLLTACGSGSSLSSGTNTGTPPPVTPPSSGNTNQLGISISAPLDWEENRLYADLVRMSRTFRRGADANSATLATVDTIGWPTEDFSFYLWHGIGNMHGTYTLTFTGQASVTANPGGAVTVNYDAASNTSTGTIVYGDASSSYLTLAFAGTRRTGTSATGSGVTNIKLMRPTSPGATTSYPATTLFNAPIKALIAKFGTIRFMDFLATNSNRQVTWSERPLPNWPSFHRLNNTNGYGWQGIGGPWEHVVLLANETGKDAWINIPVGADDNYVRNVARLIAYGSDGVNPYTSTQANPVYPPLNTSLRVYVEFSNELWNSAGAFTQMAANCQAASDELVATGGMNPLNWDNVWNNITYGTNGWTWVMCDRRTAKRSVEISNIFRSVFGDAAMGARIRPVLMSQLGNSGAALFNFTKMLMNYYNNLEGNFVATPHPPNYYFYGGGGSGYYNPANTVSTLDEFFADAGMTPAGITPALQADIKLLTAMGMKRVAYEGGPSLDRLGGARDAISPLAINDARMTTAMVDIHNAWSNNGGELFMYFSAAGDYQWGFTPNIYDLSTRKLQAIDALNAAAPASLTYGTAVPATVAGGNADTCERGWGCSPIQSWDSFTADGSSILWASYSFRSAASANWTVSLTITSPSAGATVSLYVDGALIGTQSASGTVNFNAANVGAGLHGVVIRAATGSFKVGSVSVATN